MYWRGFLFDGKDDKGSHKWPRIVRFWVFSFSHRFARISSSQGGPKAEKRGGKTQIILPCDELLRNISGFATQKILGGSPVLLKDFPSDHRRTGVPRSAVPALVVYRLISNTDLPLRKENPYDPYTTHLVESMVASSCFVRSHWCHNRPAREATSSGKRNLTTSTIPGYQFPTPTQ
jgi:hypothetical protein